MPAMNCVRSCETSNEKERTLLALDWLVLLLARVRVFS